MTACEEVQNRRSTGPYVGRRPKHDGTLRSHKSSRGHPELSLDPQCMQPRALFPPITTALGSQTPTATSEGRGRCVMRCSRATAREEGAHTGGSRGCSERCGGGVQRGGRDGDVRDEGPGRGVGVDWYTSIELLVLRAAALALLLLVLQPATPVRSRCACGSLCACVFSTFWLHVGVKAPRALCHVALGGCEGGGARPGS